MTPWLTDLLETWETERLKTLSLWAAVAEPHLTLRVDPKTRTLQEHMVHQCISESTWMRTMLGFPGDAPLLPASEDGASFVGHYYQRSEAHLGHLRAMPSAWFEEPTRFFGVPKSRYWVVLRRLNHTAHHRGQMAMLLRAFGAPLYSTYGPTADTGGLFQNQAPVVYRHPNLPALLAHVREGGELPALPGPRGFPLTERPG